MHILIVAASLLSVVLLAGLGPYQLVALVTVIPPIVALSKLLAPDGSTRGRIAHSLYISLSMAASSLSFLGLEALWAVYGVGAAIGLWSVLRGRARLGLSDPLPYLLVAYLVAMIYWTYPVYYIAPLIVSLVAAILADDMLLKILCTTSFLCYAAMVTTTPLEPLIRASQASLGLSIDLSLPQAIAALLLLFLVVGIAEELQSRAVLSVAGSVAVTGFILLHLPSRLAALSTLWSSNPPLAAVLLTTMMHYLLIPTLILVEAYRRHGLTTAILVHALFDTLVSLPEPLAIATLLVAAGMDALLRRS